MCECGHVCIFVCVLQSERLKGKSGEMTVGVYACVCVSTCSSHHILIFALDFVRSPGLPVITVGYFVRLDVLWAPDTLCTLGN